jgi:HSP20 family protein
MLGRWDPFSEMSRLQDEMYGRGSSRTMGGFTPAVDIYEEKDAIYLTAELPGVKPEDVHISVDKGVLTLRGERKMECEDKQEGYHRVERSYGSFTRSFVPRRTEAEASEEAGRPAPPHQRAWHDRRERRRNPERPSPGQAARAGAASEREEERRAPEQQRRPHVTPPPRRHHRRPRPTRDVAVAFPTRRSPCASGGSRATLR